MRPGLPSGSGKTTVLRCIAGLATAHDGEITCGGEHWWHAPGNVNLRTRERRVGMVFQSYALFEHLSTGDNIESARSDLVVEQRRPMTHSLLDLITRKNCDGTSPGWVTA